MMQKKGATIDNFYIIVSIFVFATFMLSLLVFWESAKVIPDFWDASSIGNTIKDNTDKAFQQWDFILLCAYFALHFGVLITVYFLRENPIAFILTFLLMIILPLISAPISNAYETMINDNVFVAYKDNIPIMNYIMEHLPYFEAIWSLITAVMLYGLSKY